jgi:cholesterol 7-dehydrogenase
MCGRCVYLWRLLGHSYGAALAGTYLLWVLFARPLRLIRQPHDVGYVTKEGQDMRARSAEVARRRVQGDLPPVYPNGWYELMRAAELPRGAVRQITALGRDFCVFRTQSGKVGVLDAYCPHLGANIAVGGIVVDDCVQCPFHGWSFTTDGTCKHIPYSKSIPARSDIRKFPSLEINDQILLWFDAEGREPFWFPPRLEEIENGTWSYRGTTQHPINAHIQEVPENAADIAHLNFLHRPGIAAGTDLRYTQGCAKSWVRHGISSLMLPNMYAYIYVVSRRFTFMQHGWNADWAPVEEEGKKHLSVLKLLHYLILFGRHIPLLDLHVTATQVL